MPLLLLVAIRIRTRSRISQFAIRLAHKKVTHKVGQKERKKGTEEKKRESKNREAAGGDCFEIGSRCRLQRVAQS